MLEEKWVNKRWKSQYLRFKFTVQFTVPILKLNFWCSVSWEILGM